MDQALEPKPPERPSEGPEALARELGEVRQRCAALERRAAGYDELIGVVTHELRTPLAVISGFGRMLLSERAGPLNDDQRRFVEESLRSCRRLDGFVSELLAGVEPWCPASVVPRPASLQETIEGVVAFFEPLLEERGLRIQLALEADRARFDPERIVQVLTNLVGNALRYAPEGSTVGIETRPADDLVEVVVSDAGPGVPEADRERIFEPGARGADGQHSRGLGLGLAICRRIVEAHGGGIRVDRAREGGCRFAFTLPCAGSGEGPA